VALKTNPHRSIAVAPIRSAAVALLFGPVKSEFNEAGARPGRLFLDDLLIF
jgi:hypothetical protein